LLGCAAALAAGLWGASAAFAAAGTLTLAVQPILSEQRTQEAYRPLCDFISEITSMPCEVRTAPNFLTYWQTTYKGSFDLFLDAAHFTDYRAQKLNYSVLAKVPDKVSYTLVVRDDRLVFDASELIGKTIATLGPPSIGAARLEAMFPNPTRQPIIVEVASAEEGLQQLIAGEVAAAILPSPLISQQMAAGAGIAVVTITPQIPHIALSASPNVDADVRKRISDALVGANRTPRGQAMLEAIGFPAFDPANAEIYAGQSDILKGTWGY
jgi:phosphonate transport system substrate-binding protein